MSSGARPRRILLVEDEPADAEFTRYAFENGRLDHEVEVRSTGRGAIEYITAARGNGVNGVDGGNYAPDLVLLDVNLPDMTGFEVLERLRSMGSVVPVIVLSTSNYPPDVHAAYSQGANAFVQKPSRLAGFDSLVEAVERFWFGAAILPSTPGD